MSWNTVCGKALPVLGLHRAEWRWQEAMGRWEQTLVVWPVALLFHGVVINMTG